MDSTNDENTEENNTTSPASATSPATRQPPSDAICRICRGGHTESSKPLYHPCPCRGSIKYIHEQCLAEWLEHSGQNKCEVCHFEYQYNLEWDQNVTPMHHVAICDFIRYFLKTLCNALLYAARAVFVITLWFLVFVLNTVLISPFLPAKLINTLFMLRSSSNTTMAATDIDIGTESALQLAQNVSHAMQEVAPTWFIPNRLFAEGHLSTQSLIIAVGLGGFAQIVLFIVLCVFEFHHRHRDAVAADFEDAFLDDNPPPLPPLEQQPQQQQLAADLDVADDDDDELDEDADVDVEDDDDGDQEFHSSADEQKAEPHDDDEEQDNDNQNEPGGDADEAGRDENGALGFAVLPPEEDAGFLNPDNIRDARAIELLGLDGRFNAFFSTIVSVTVFNIALISSLFWLPTIVGHFMIVFRSRFYELFVVASKVTGVLYRRQPVQWLLTTCSLCAAFIVPVARDASEWLTATLNIGVDVDMCSMLASQTYTFCVTRSPRVAQYLLDRPMLYGYIVLFMLGLLVLAFDLAYYHLKRPSLVVQRQHLKDTRSKDEIATAWVLCEELSRLHTIFWRLIDSVFRVLDFVFQLVVVPYVFGRVIALATQCIRSPVGVAEPGDSDSADATAAAGTATDIVNEIFLYKERTNGTSGSSLLSRLKLPSLFALLDVDSLATTSSFTDDDSRLLRALEGSVLQHMSYWIVGFWYIYGTMKIFSQARNLMRIEFNACWMRFPQPHQIPITLSVVRAMKERLISMRIHVPLIFMGIHIPCKLMLRMFPSAFPVKLYSLNLHKWPTAGMLFMISCVLATILRRLRVHARWNRIARHYLDTVGFALGIRYLIVPGSVPGENVLIEVDDADAQRLLLEPVPGDLPADLVGRPILQILMEDPNRIEAENHDDANAENAQAENVAENAKDENDEKVEESENAIASPPVSEAAIAPSASLLNDVDENADRDVREQAICVGLRRKNTDADADANDEADSSNALELQGQKEQLLEENVHLKARIERLKNTRDKLQRRLRRKKKQKKKKVARKDNVFLTPHPWQIGEDVYARLQTERRSYMQRCPLYTIGVSHIRLRVFAFVLCLWVTHILTVMAVFLGPLVCGRLIYQKYFQSFSNQHHIQNTDLIAYIFGLFFCVILPNEIHFLLSYHFRGTLLNNVRKSLIRAFIFVFIPLYLGYAWNTAIYHFVHNMSVTPLYCLLELYCTGIYLTIICLLFQNHHELQNVLLWMQNHQNINLRRFWREFAYPVLKILVFHVSLPIAIRYWMVHYVQHTQQHDALSLDGAAAEMRPTVILDLQTISNESDKKDLEMQWLEKSVLQLQPILLDQVYLHYNSYELYLFLSCNIWRRFYEFVCVQHQLNVFAFLAQPFLQNTVITNLDVLLKFLQFMIRFLLIKCPIPFFAALNIVWMGLNKFIHHIPKIKDIILQERYFANRRLANFENLQNADDKRKQEAIAANT